MKVKVIGFVLSLLFVSATGCAAVLAAKESRLPKQTFTAVSSSIPSTPTETACAVTPPVYDEPPDDPNADPFGYGPWQINAERTIWAALPPDESWGTEGEKVIWIRPAGTRLTITGERIDKVGPPLEVNALCCYLTGFQVTGLTFPERGCWRVTAEAGDQRLSFVTEVK